jgi:acyl-CoA thioester hydrolase
VTTASTEPAGKLVRWREPVQPEWVDYNGHLSEAYYVLVFGHATDAVLAAVGLGEEYRAATGASLFTVEAHVRYLDQVTGSDELEVRSSVVGAGTKTLHVWHELWVGGRLRATEEVLGVHVDVASARATPLPDAVAAAVERLRVEPPADAGRSVRRQS